MSHDQTHGQPAHRSDPAPPNPQGEPANGWHGVEPDTSERLYTSEEFAAYSDARLRQAEQPLPPAPQGDPLNDPMPGESTQIRQPYAAPQPPQAPPGPLSEPAPNWTQTGPPAAPPTQTTQAQTTQAQTSQAQRPRHRRSPLPSRPR